MANRKKENQIEDETEKITRDFVETFMGYPSSNDPRRENTNETIEKYGEKNNYKLLYLVNRNYAHDEATKQTAENFIKGVSELRVNDKINCSDIEILALSAICDQIDFSFVVGAFVTAKPTPVDRLEKRFLYDEDDKLLPGIVNNLSRKYDVNPFELEKRIKELYPQVRHLNKAYALSH